MKEFEKNLIQKIDELSDAVDCFDKISKRAFPEENKCLTDDGFYTESELENITGKRNFRLAPIFAVICVIVGISFIFSQQNVKEFLYNLSNENLDYNTYNDIKSEFEKEIQTNSYIYSDYTFEEYQMNIVCINPFAYCDTLSTNIEDTNIRVYTKFFTIGRETIETNQIYLIHYKGDFCEENIISITDSTAKLNDDDRWEAINEENNTYSQISWKILYPNALNSVIIPDNPLNDMINPFEIGYRNIFKDGDNTYDLYTSAIYWFDDFDSDKKHYSMMSYFEQNDKYNVFDTPENNWNDTVFQYGDETGFTEETEKLFEREYITDKIVNEFTGYNNNVFLSKIFDKYNNTSPEHYRYYNYNLSNSCKTTNVKIYYYEDITSNLILIKKHTQVFHKLINGKENSTNIESDINLFDFNTIEQFYEYSKTSFDNSSSSNSLKNPDDKNNTSEYYAELELMNSEIAELYKQLESKDETENEIIKIKDEISKIENNKMRLLQEIEVNIHSMIIEHIEKEFNMNPDDVINFSSEIFDSVDLSRNVIIAYSAPDNMMRIFYIQISLTESPPYEWEIKEISQAVAPLSDTDILELF